MDYNINLAGQNKIKLSPLAFILLSLLAAALLFFLLYFGLSILEQHFTEQALLLEKELARKEDDLAPLLELKAWVEETEEKLKLYQALQPGGETASNVISRVRSQSGGGLKIDSVLIDPFNSATIKGRALNLQQAAEFCAPLDEEEGFFKAELAEISFAAENEYLFFVTLYLNGTQEEGVHHLPD